MRVGIAIHRFPPSVGGSEGYAGRLAQELTDRGHEVVVFTSAHPAREPLAFRVHGLRPADVTGPFVAWPSLLAPRVAREVVSCDVLHAINFTSFAALAWLAIGRRYGRPLVLTTFYHPPRATKHPALAALYDRTVGRVIANGYGALLIHSLAEGQALRRHVTSRPEARIRQLTFPPLIAGVAPDASFRRAYGLDGSFVVLYVGHDAPHEGRSTLVRAAAELRAEGALPELRLVIVGPAGQHANGATHVATPLTPAQLASAYTASDVVVVPSAYESYGLVVLEALSYGTPVITTRTGAATAFVRHGETGYVFDHGDVVALKRSLVTIRTTGPQMREAARRSVAHLSWKDTVDGTLAAYREVLVPVSR
jgi:D-inositol-3-phosphate glycosyltransferase